MGVQMEPRRHTRSGYASEHDLGAARRRRARGAARQLAEALPLEAAVGERRRRGSSDHVARRNSAQRHRRRDRLDFGGGRAARARRNRRCARRGSAHPARHLAHAPREPRHLRALVAERDEAARCVSLSRSESGSGEPHRRLRSDRGLPILGAHDLSPSRRRRRSATAPPVLRRARR